MKRYLVVRPGVFCSLIGVACAVRNYIWMKRDNDDYTLNTTTYADSVKINVDYSGQYSFKIQRETTRWVSGRQVRTLVPLAEVEEKTIFK